MLNEEFLNGLLGKEDVSAEDKIKQIIAEHDAETRGLLAKRDELLGNEKKLKEKISGYEKGIEESNSKIKGLEEMLEKANNGDQKAKEYYETKLADLQKNYDGQISSLTAERDQYKTLHLTSLRDKAIEDGTKEINFVPGLKQGFIARVLSLNNFEPQDIPGQGLQFVNQEHHTIEEAISAFALTQEGKAYIANPSTGGGARGSGVGGTFTDTKVVSRKQFENMPPQTQNEFIMKGGTITD